MHDKTAAAVLDFVGVASEFGDRLVNELNVHLQAQKRAADQRPIVLAALLEVGCVPATRKTAADAMLGSHAETLGLFKQALDRLAELAAENAALRKKSGIKEAGDAAGGKAVIAPTTLAPAATQQSLTGNYIGRKTTEKKASDIVWENAMRNQRAGV